MLTTLELRWFGYGIVPAEDDWWSIAFEGLEENTNRLDSFVNIVSEVSKTYQGLELLFDSSYAYPRWLSLVISSQI